MSYIIVHIISPPILDAAKVTSFQLPCLPITGRCASSKGGVNAVVASMRIFPGEELATVGEGTHSPFLERLHGQAELDIQPGYELDVQAIS